MRRWIGLGLALAAAGCGGAPATVSDTGYVGTWSRGNERVTSTIQIAKDGGGYRFRWTKDAEDGRSKVRCTWDGVCEESFEGKKIADYKFRTWVDGETGNLRLECFETRTVPEPWHQRYVDELTVEGDGRILRSVTLERNDEVYPPGARPMRTFDKRSDAVDGFPAKDGA